MKIVFSAFKNNYSKQPNCYESRRYGSERSKSTFLLDQNISNSYFFIMQFINLVLDSGLFAFSLRRFFSILYEYRCSALGEAQPKRKPKQPQSSDLLKNLYTSNRSTYISSLEHLLQSRKKLAIKINYKLFAA